MNWTESVACFYWLNLDPYPTGPFPPTPRSRVTWHVHRPRSILDDTKVIIQKTITTKQVKTTPLLCLPFPLNISGSWWITVPHGSTHSVCVSLLGYGFVARGPNLIDVLFIIISVYFLKLWLSFSSPLCSLEVPYWPFQRQVVWVSARPAFPFPTLMSLHYKKKKKISLVRCLCGYYLWIPP